MDSFNKKYGHPVVDFDWFSFEPRHGAAVRNQRVAEQLAVILMSQSCQDSLQHTTEFDPDNSWTTTVGTGGCGQPMPCMTQAHQRAILAAHFATYSQYHYECCYLGLPDYECLKQLVEDMDYYGTQGQRRQQLDLNIALVHSVLREFEDAYVRKDPDFLFEILKRQDN